MKSMTSKNWLVVLSVGLLLIMFSNNLKQPLAGTMLLNGLAIAGLAALQLVRHRKDKSNKKQPHAEED